MSSFLNSMPIIISTAIGYLMYYVVDRLFNLTKFLNGNIKIVKNNWLPSIYICISFGLIFIFNTNSILSGILSGISIALAANTLNLINKKNKS